MRDDGNIELFNINEDPEEIINLANEERDVVKNLTMDMSRYIKSLKEVRMKSENEKLKKIIKNLKLKGKI